MTALAPRVVRGQPDIVPTPLLPPGFGVPPTRWIHPSIRMRELLRTEPYLFGPGVYDPMGAQLVMHHGFKAVYFSGYSFAIGHLGTTDMDLYSGPEIADGARRTVSALRKYQLTAAVGDPEKGVAPRHLDIPPVIVDMDAGYGNIFNVQRQTELLVTAGVASAHLEDQVLPKRCGHIGGKALEDGIFAGGNPEPEAPDLIGGFIAVLECDLEQGAVGVARRRRRRRACGGRPEAAPRRAHDRLGVRPHPQCVARDRGPPRDAHHRRVPAEPRAGGEQGGAR